MTVKPPRFSPEWYNEAQLRIDTFVRERLSINSNIEKQSLADLLFEHYVKGQTSYNFVYEMDHLEDDVLVQRLYVISKDNEEMRERFDAITAFLYLLFN